LGPDVDLATEDVRDARGQRITEVRAAKLADDAIVKVSGQPSVLPGQLKVHRLSAKGEELRDSGTEFLFAPRRLTTDQVASYLGTVDDPIIAHSARKHGIGEEEILHAYRNPVRSWDLGDGFIMLIGANAAVMTDATQR
jgi:DNA polymerase III epsilon subunit-like protein